MKIHRIYAVILRFIFLFRRSYERISDSFYWPAIDLILWGLASTYFTKQAPDTSKLLLVIISGLLLWIIVWRGQYEITVNLLEELWNKNLINLFASPLKFSEWITSLVALSVIKAIASFAFASLLAYMLYKINVYYYGFYFLPMMLMLIMTGWFVGFFIAGIILRYGTKYQTLAWSTIAVFAPFSGVFYPISILPDWAQKIAALVPSSYIFEGGREMLFNNTLDVNKIFISLGLNLIYMVLSIWFLKKSFKKALEKGFIKIY